MMYQTVPRFLWPLLMRGITHDFRKHTENLRKYIRRHVEEHVATFDPAHPRDVLDGYIEARGHDLAALPVANTLLGLLPDGVQSTGGALRFLLYMLAKNPDVQERLHNDIEVVVGSGRKVTTRDRSALPSVDAAILESLRLLTPVAMTTPRVPQRDLTLRGYTLPRGCWVFANHYALHRDPDIYPDPETFTLDRFLGPHGDVIKTDAWMPFSIGTSSSHIQVTLPISYFLLNTCKLGLYETFHIRVYH